jgi:hypothetical protein
LGGSDETVAELLKTLRHRLRAGSSASFPVDYKQDTEQKIVEHAELVWNRQQFEEQLVDQVLGAAKSGSGFLGIKPTLSALVEEKVRALLIADGLAIDGSVCTHCEYFPAGEFKNARFATGCGTEGMLQTGLWKRRLSQEPSPRLSAQATPGIVCSARAKWECC